jgi:hypothetical protein
MPTLRTAATTSSTHVDQVPPVTPIVTPAQIHTPADELARSALYVVRRDVGLQGTPRKNVTSPRRDLIVRLISLF